MTATFEAAFDVPAGHSVRLVGSGLRGRLRVWEHEEYDADGALAAVYESWSREPAQTVDGQDRGPEGFVKYSPNGWILRRSEVEPRAWANIGGEIRSAVFLPPSMRRSMEGQDPA